MKKNPICLPLITAIGTMVLLYLMGGAFNIPFLEWSFYKATPPSGDFLYKASGSLIPIIIGVMVGFVTEWLVKKKQSNTM